MLSDLSPKDLAAVIGASESSLKRWVDEGRLKASRTSGGHRRIPLPEAVRFIRTTNAQIGKPEILGITELNSATLREVVDGRGDAALLDSLERRESARARGLILAFHLKTPAVASVCDGPISFALHRMQRNPDDMESIRVAQEICASGLRQIRAMLGEPREDAPLALACTPETENFRLGSLMASTVLLENGFRDKDCGIGVPLKDLERLVSELRPAIMWVSINTVESRDEALAHVGPLSKTCGRHGTVLLVGGWAMCQRYNNSDASSHFANSLSELGSAARAAKARLQAGRAGIR